VEVDTARPGRELGAPVTERRRLQGRSLTLLVPAGSALRACFETRGARAA
jgi:hypothetical protein